MCSNLRLSHCTGSVRSRVYAGIAADVIVGITEFDVGIYVSLKAQEVFVHSGNRWNHGIKWYHAVTRERCSP